MLCPAVMRGARSTDKSWTEVIADKMAKTVSSASESGQSLSPFSERSH